MMSSDDTVLHNTRIWLEKAVIGLNLCPFAKAPYVKDQVRISISHAKHLDAFLELVDKELTLLSTTPADIIETTLIVEPTLFDDFNLFNDVAMLAENAISEHHLEGIIQIAFFHPDFQFEGTQANDISNYTNRSPYPTLHLIRESSISKATEAFPDPAAIFERNIALLEKMGHQGWQALEIPNPHSATNTESSPTTTCPYQPNQSS